jgi:hypothetical protein
MGWVVNDAPRPLYPRKRPGTHCVGDWVGPRNVLDGCEKYRPHRDLIPGPSNPCLKFCNVRLLLYYTEQIFGILYNKLCPR